MNLDLCIIFVKHRTREGLNRSTPSSRFTLRTRINPRHRDRELTPPIYDGRPSSLMGQSLERILTYQHPDHQHIDRLKHRHRLLRYPTICGIPPIL